MQTQHLNNNQKKYFLVGVILLTVWIITTVIPVVIHTETARLFSEIFDRYVYFERGKWLTEGTPPMSEYPQIPTILFGVNRITSMWAAPYLQPAIYAAIFSVEMLFVLFLVFRLLLKSLPRSFSNYAFLLLLHPTLYFTYSRFDILPAYFCLLAYHVATRRQWTMASILLSVATFTKWYPILLFPGFFMYATTIESKIQWKMIMSFTLISSVIMLFSYLFGGLAAILAPYQFHITRSMEYTALPALIDHLLRSVFDIRVNLPYFFLFLFVMQVMGPILIFFAALDSPEALVDYSIVAIGLFVLFSRIWSPQWLLWLMPFLILLAKNRKTVALIVGYNLLTYISFPIIFDFYGGSSYPLEISSLLTYFILCAIIFQSLKNLKWRFYFADLKVKKTHLTPLVANQSDLSQ